MSVESTVNLARTSSAGFYSATASGSVTTLGSTNSVSGTNISHFPDSNEMTITGGGTFTHSQTVHLSGEEGTFSFTIAGAFQVGGTVTANISISTVGVADIRATLQKFDPSTNSFVSAGGQRNPDFKSVVVN